MKILLIEDSKTLQRIVRKFVEDAGHQISTADTGEVALQLLENEQFDLIISDVDMPGLCGFDTVTLIREMLGEHWVPIIFLTSRDEDSDYLEGFESGGDDYIIKPVREVVLMGKIRVMERFINMQNKLYEVLNQPEPPTQFDKLTHTYTGHSFMHMATIQWSVLLRRKEPVSLIIVDIDYFNEYKEAYGAARRDECLVQVSKAIKNSAHRPNDFVGRLNKHDFVMMLPDTEQKGAMLMASRVAQAVESLNLEHRSSPVSGIVSVSVAGVSVNSVENLELQELFSRAASLLHKVKYGDGDSVCVLELD